MAAPLIDARALSRRFGTVMALDGFTVSIASGITGLVGANGAGKSTFIRILLGLVEPSSGEVSLLGQDVRRSADAIRALVGYMPEHDCLPPDMSGAEFTTFMGRLSGLPAHVARERSAEVLRHVGLFEERYRPIGTYSTGMAQRVKLAQALVHDPRVLILDEPTNGLDPAGREEMLGLIRRTGREFGLSVLLSSHLLGELERICDGIVQMDRGRLVRAESMDELTGETGDLLVEVDGDLPRFVTALRARVQGVAEVQVERQWVRVQMGDAPKSVNATERVHDAVRDAVVEADVGLLRMERRRARLDDLFRESTPATGAVS
ncbi:MAG TPA: ABC transporter ATP-binding protein [Gemmatimonas sp.]|uniref:ABC transporter ATP-binding protein n=1 Tax=Gemmatimonas sp. TaxID=1962908 RepID=UPI002EDA8885